MSEPRVLVVNQYYAPDLASTGQIAAEIFEGLVERGFAVSVVAAEPSYEPDASAAPQREVRRGVEVHRVSVAPFSGKESLFSRFGGYSRFMIGAWRRARSVAREFEPDVVLTFHNPPFVGLLGAHLSRKFDVPYVYSPQDILPDVVVRGGWILPDFAVRWWEKLNAHVYESADEVVVLGRGMKQVLSREKGVDPKKINSTVLWAQPELDPGQDEGHIREELGVGDDLLLLYSGNMGYMHAIRPILEAARTLADEPVQFVFVGRGPKRTVVEDAIEGGQHPNVQLLPYQPKETFKQLVASADAAFVTLDEGMERLAVPSRALTFLSGGTPLLVGMKKDGEIALLVDDEECGWVVENVGELVNRIREIMNQPSDLERRADRASQVYGREFGRSRTVEMYASVLRAAASSESGEAK